MAWFGKGETLGKLLVKVRADWVSSAHRGQQPTGSAWFHQAENLAATGMASSSTQAQR
jgi:hypothetical protein